MLVISDHLGSYLAKTLQNPLSRLFTLRVRTAWLIFAASLLMVFVVWYAIKFQNEHNAKLQFNLHANEIVSLIEQRLQHHEQILLGGAGLYDASSSVERQEWHDYIERLELKNRYPGILGVGFSEVIKPKDLKQHIERVRAEGFPDYIVKPPGDRKLYTAITYLEPFSGRNLAAFGYDMFSQATRAEAMTIAAERGETAISGKVKLVQETHGKIQAGFLMYVPVYSKNSPQTNPGQRWDALRGFVYSPYRVDDLMNGILGKRNPYLDFLIFDGRKVDEKELMYASTEQSTRSEKTHHTALYSAERQINAYHHTWTVSLKSRPQFELQFDSTLQWVVLSLGILISLLLFFIVWVLIFRRERALVLAQNMTVKIRENEESLRLSEERFQLAVRGSNDGIWDWNLVSNEIYFAARYKALLGYSEDEFPNEFSSFEESLHPEDRKRVMVSVNNHLDKAEPYDVTFRLKTKKGKWQWFRGRGEAVRNKKGVAVRMAGSISDISSQKEAEVKLEAIAQHSQTILDNIVDGIITTDRKGEIISFNNAAEIIFGYSEGSVIGKNMSMLLLETDNIQDLFSPKNSINAQELYAIHRNGNEFTMELTVTSIRSGDRELMICVVRDITERKRVDKLKSEFVSTVSHELRTPLTSINGALGLLTSGTMGELSEQVNTLTQTAYRNTQRLAMLIDDLLDMEKIAAGQMQFDLHDEDIVPQVELSIESSQQYADQYQVNIRLNRQVKDVVVEIDNQRFQQVMSNLLSNAIKFSPQGLSVEVNIDLLEEAVRVSVSDHGPGVPLDFHDRIFQKFSQADSSDTRQKGGTGLGLAISREIIEHMNGQIGFYSKENMGATFYFDLPIASDKHKIDNV